MNLNWVSSSVIVNNLDVTYNINSNNYIHKLSFWITQALANYKVYIPLEPAFQDIAIGADRTLIIPEDVKGIVGLSYNGEYLRQGKCYRGFSPVGFDTYNDLIARTGFVVTVTRDVDGNIISNYTTDALISTDVVQRMNAPIYYINNSRVITLEIGEVGELVRLHYIRIPFEYDEFTGGYLAKVPDNEVIQQNISWFVLRNLLYGGYSHPILNLGAAMPYLNPAKMYDTTFAGARSQFLKWDRADYGKVKNLFTTLVQAYHDDSLNLTQH